VGELRAQLAQVHSGQIRVPLSHLDEYTVPLYLPFTALLYRHRQQRSRIVENIDKESTDIYEGQRKIIRNNAAISHGSVDHILLGI